MIRMETTDLLEIGDIFYNSAWYRLPIKEQRLLALPIQRSQREFRLSGLGFLDCSLAVYSSVKLLFSIKFPSLYFIEKISINLHIIQTASSYFLILRSFK